jgi:hypothetical protein
LTARGVRHATRTIMVQTAEDSGNDAPSQENGGDFHKLFHSFCDNLVNPDGDVT